MDAKTSPWADGKSGATDTTTGNTRVESKEESERLFGARKMGVSCFWHFDKDQIVAKHNGVHGRGDTVVEALEDLCEGLRRRTD